MATLQSRILFAKRHYDDDAVTNKPPNLLTPTTEKKKSSVEATRYWRCKMKTDDPEKYAIFLEQSRIYSQNYRQHMTDDQRVISNEQAAARMRSMRRKESRERKPALTGSAREEQRQKWVSQKQRQQEKLRNTLTSLEYAQHRWQNNKRRREKYQLNKLAGSGYAKRNTLEVPLSCSTELPPQEQLPSCPRSPGAGNYITNSRTPIYKRKTISRPKAAPQLSPMKIFPTLNYLLATASPMKQALVQSEQHQEKKNTPTTHNGAAASLRTAEEA